MTIESSEVARLLINVEQAITALQRHTENSDVDEAQEALNKIVVDNVSNKFQELQAQTYALLNQNN